MRVALFNAHRQRVQQIDIYVILLLNKHMAVVVDCINDSMHL